MADPKAKRSDFSESVVKVLGEQVALLCSNPQCRVSTSGPGKDPEHSTKTGQGAHIYAASKNGPRPAPSGMTTGEVESAKNGIYLCADCHKAVDDDEVRYAVTVLTRWKEEAEEYARSRRGKRVPVHLTDRGAVTGYLKALVGWLGEDPWAAESPGPHPAAIERKLRIQARGLCGDADADRLADACQRLVILGGPGSGKTWLARRIARRHAEKALAALDAGASMDEVELPLYTTASLLAQADGGIRAAVASSALDRVPGIGTGSTVASLRRFFADRQGRVLLVIDSLDEASAPGPRMREADTEFREWRIILTSRPSSWRPGLIEIRQVEPRHRVGNLQPLRFPEDVEAFIAAWFTGARGKGEALAAEIRRSRSLQQFATVPLLLAFYCIAARANGGIPQSQAGLFDLVVRRLLVGSWRAEDREPDEEGCLRLLEEWAWAAAAKDDVSGVGTWADEFPADASPRDPAILEAVAHVAVPLSPREPGTRDRKPTVMRRFIHRSIREYLVASHLAAQPCERVADELVNHLWHDPDWEQAAPMALALHPDHDAILQAMLRRITQSERIPDDLRPFDSGFDLCWFLSEAAMNLPADKWAPDLREVIAQGRHRLSLEGYGDLSPAPGWSASDRKIRADLVARIAKRTRMDSGDAFVVLRRLLLLCPRREEVNRAQRIILDHVGRKDDCFRACWLADLLPQTDLGPEELSDVREKLWGFLRGKASIVATCTVATTLAKFDPSDAERDRLRALVVQAGSGRNRIDDIHVLSALTRLVKDPVVSLVMSELDHLFIRGGVMSAEAFKAFRAGDRAGLRGITDCLVSKWNGHGHPVVPVNFSKSVDDWPTGARKVFRETLLGCWRPLLEETGQGNWLFSWRPRSGTGRAGPRATDPAAEPD